jgi:uncharacterized protein
MLIETALNQACAQFNAGDFYACHETLEPLWLAASGTERTYWHALIQAAVALHHHQRGNKKGALSLHTRAQNKFSQLPPRMHGLDLLQFSLALEAFFGTVYASPAEAIAYPRMQLTSDQ